MKELLKKSIEISKDCKSDERRQVGRAKASGTRNPSVQKTFIDEVNSGVVTGNPEEGDLRTRMVAI